MELYAAFTLGLLGSLHCVGMCGPLMLAAATGGGWKNPLIYQAGRLSTYLLLGGLLGGLGLGMQLWNAQGAIAAISGMLLIVLAMLRLDPGNMLQRWPAYNRFQVRVRTWMSVALQKRGLGGQFTLGVCNGLLPCGLVYLAIIAAANAGTPLAGATFMLAFGLGTLPLLVATLFAGKRLLRLRPDLLPKWTPLVMAVVGIFLLWRGYVTHLPGEFHHFQDMAFPPMCH